MLTIFYKFENQVISSNQLDILQHIPLTSVIWVDLLQPSTNELEALQSIFQIEFLTREEAEEIQSRYFEVDSTFFINLTCISQKQSNVEQGIISFILKDNTLFSIRQDSLSVFTEISQKTFLNSKYYQNGIDVLTSFFEHIIENDADTIEYNARHISKMSKKLSLERSIDEQLIIDIANFQESTMLIRQNVIEKQRVLSAMLKSKYFQSYNYEDLRILIKDTGSLLDHSAFSFERLEYLQNTFMGLINIEQNKIIKIFTVVSVIFMPPTLIASIYGMNFKVMPELDWMGGYPFALGLMVLSSIITLFFFKKKQWL
ncbi:magnesium/cobalt transporter CorA [Thermoflexibacter ruber]|uniref:Magnesium transport protein CorA n=1 Tax=Thermoflexibacter ruber TaxID=1003 RepID=A0A1I2GAW4_9BACT|nr:magnesium/cobalt transporter CorA [Thermoflexibacter ruber]SFF13896.1 magnesium transporter [Thermoflexibacter ruber]